MGYIGWLYMPINNSIYIMGVSENGGWTPKFKWQFFERMINQWIRGTLNVPCFQTKLYGYWPLFMGHIDDLCGGFGIYSYLIFGQSGWPMFWVYHTLLSHPTPPHPTPPHPTPPVTAHERAVPVSAIQQEKW